MVGCSLLVMIVGLSKYLNSILNVTPFETLGNRCLMRKSHSLLSCSPLIYCRLTLNIHMSHVMRVAYIACTCCHFCDFCNVWLCHSIIPHSTLIIFYYASMSTLQDSLCTLVATSVILWSLEFVNSILESTNIVTCMLRCCIPNCTNPACHLWGWLWSNTQAPQGDDVSTTHIEDHLNTCVA